VRTDLNETFRILKKLIGYTGDVKYEAERAGDVKHSLADLSRAQKHLGYKPKVDFEEGLRRTIEWYKSGSVGRASDFGSTMSDAVVESKHEFKM
jgi:UDP-glucose 4-epimerase